MVFKYKDRDVAVIAHRGGGLLFPENTISAFKGVQKLGVDAVECDVQHGYLFIIKQYYFLYIIAGDIRYSLIYARHTFKIRVMHDCKFSIMVSWTSHSTASTPNF